jgi:hypothetical protein
MRTISVMMLAMSVGAGSVSAQSMASAQPHAQALRTAWDGAKKNIVESSTIMEEANYAFKPVETVRTFGQILGHVAGANYVFCSAAPDGAAVIFASTTPRCCSSCPQSTSFLNRAVDLVA